MADLNNTLVKGNLRVTSDINANGDIYTNGKKVVQQVSSNRPGVNRLYRGDDDSGYYVAPTWTGSYWILKGYNGDSEHAGCQVAYATSAGSANTAGSAATASALGVTEAVGSGTNPVYINSNGVPVACTYTIAKSVPSNADFSNTWRPIGTGATDACAGNDSRLSDSRTPTAHASSSTTYGVGTTSNYGHVKLVTGDLYNNNSGDGYAAGASHTHSQYMTTSSAVERLQYTTTVPTSANASGLKIYVGSTNPSTKYTGWLYLITS